MNVAISGSRTFTDRRFVELVIERLSSRGYRVIIGDAPSGVDLFAWEYLRARTGINWTRHEANWNKLGRAAGHERNGRMIEDADMLIAIFAPGPRTPGTSDALKQALFKGIPAYIFQDAWTLSDPSGVEATRWLSDAEGKA